MKQKRRLPLAAVLCLSLLTTLTACEADSEAIRPNIILIVTDDQGYKDVGFNGSKDIPTPHIDRIAHEGVRFERGYVSGPVCGPSRAGFLTGRYQSRFGFDWNPSLNPDDATAGIPLSEKIIPEYLTPLGYTSMIVGKWHMGTHPNLRPLKRGFDEFYGFLAGGHNYFPEDIYLDDLSNSKSVDDWYHDRLRHNEQYHELQQYLTDELSDRAIDFVNRSKHKPFFLYLAYNAPHTPLQATSKYLSRFTHIKDERRKTYAAMISAVDDGVGRLLDSLQKHDLEENTLIFFLSDNGGRTPKRPGEHRVANNAPLRGGKGQLWEGGIRVPFAMRWPAQITAGIVYDKPVISLDILATIISQLGIRQNLKKALDGTDLIPFLTGQRQDAPHDNLFWRHLSKGHAAVIRDDTKYIEDKEGRQLYDLAKDISESVPINSRKDETLQRLKAAHQDWNAQMAEEAAFQRRTSWPPKN